MTTPLSFKTIDPAKLNTMIDAALRVPQERRRPAWGSGLVVAACVACIALLSVTFWAPASSTPGVSAVTASLDLDLEDSLFEDVWADEYLWADEVEEG